MLCRTLSAVVFTLLISAHALAASVTIGFIPTDNGEDLKARSEELVARLGKKTGLTVQAYIGTGYDDLIQKMAEKKIDFAFLSALAFVEAEKKVGAKVLLKKVWGTPYYHSAILVKAGSRYRKLSDLTKARLTFVDPKSASGYLLPALALRKAAVAVPAGDIASAFSGSHEKSVERLKKGETDAIAVYSNERKGKDSAWTQAGLKLKDVRVLWESEPIPNDPFCVRGSYYDRNPKIAHEVMFALMEMIEDPAEGEAVKRLLGAKSLMLATKQQYEPLRELTQESK